MEMEMDVEDLAVPAVKHESGSSDATVSPEPEGDDASQDRMDNLKLIQLENMAANPASTRAVEIKRATLKKQPAKAMPKKRKLSPKVTSGELLYCTCHKPQNGRWMIGCDFCPDWFHGDCVDMNEKKAELVVKFACPRCVELGRVGVWKRRCRLPGCLNPLPAVGSQRSKYCSREHGVQFMKLYVHSIAGVNDSQLAAILGSAGNVETLRSLGSKRPEIPLDKVELSLDPAALAEMNKEREGLQQKLARLQKRKDYIQQARDRTKHVNEEIAAELGKKRDVCGMDENLLDSETLPDAFPWTADQGREGMCLVEKRKCLRHGGWQAIMLDDALLCERTYHEELDRLDKQYNRLLDEQRTRLLEAL